MKIERKTTGGWLELREETPLERCASHGDDRPEEPDLLIGIAVVTSQGRRFETAMCSDCIATALAHFWGAQHVREGGSVDDLQVDPPNTPDGTPERRACLEAGGHFWSGYNEETNRSMPCKRCGFDPGWVGGGANETDG